MVPTILFWLSFGLIAYTYAGYALALFLLGRLFAPPSLRASITPSVSLLIVAHNEQRNITARIRNCLALDYPREKLEIVIVSDGSTDETEAIVSSFADQGVRLVRVDGPKGKADALSQVVPSLKGEIVVFSDARQRFAPDAVLQLVANFADPSVGAVSGELHLEAAEGRANEGVGAYWKYEKLIRRLESRLDSVVGVTGAIYALRRKLFRGLDSRTILDDVLVPMEAVLQGYRVLFEPLAIAHDELAQSAGHEYRRKVRTLAGNYQLLKLRPGLLDPRQNRLIWQFVSHKLLRLAVPWCLLMMLVTSSVLAFAEDARFFQLVLAGQVLFYLLAGLGFSTIRKPRLVSLPYSFVILNAAAAAGLFGFLLGRERSAWKVART